MPRLNNLRHDQECFYTVRHALTDVVITARKTTSQKFIVAGISLGKVQNLNLATDYKLTRYANHVNRFLDGKVSDLKLPLDLSSVSPFQKKVLKALSKVPWGKTISYKALAAKAGCPGAIRAVASVMASNPFPLAIPCHRVISSSGLIGGFMKQTNGKAVLLKRRLLENEGVFFDDGGRIISCSKSNKKS